MNIKKVARLLNDINIPTLYTVTTIEIDREQGENTYLIRKKADKWEFAFYQERNDRLEVQKTFNNEEEASKYFYLHYLKTYFFNNYDLPFRLANEDINIGLPDCDIDNLKEGLKRLDIDDSYYSINGPIKSHSVHLETLNESESIVRFIGRNKNIIIDATPIENWLAYLNFYRKVYKLYLFDQHNKFLLDAKEIEVPFSDEDYQVVLS